MSVSGLELWMTCKKFTIWVKTVPFQGTWMVADTAPIARKFIGQPIVNLKGWMEKIGGFDCKQIDVS